MSTGRVVFWAALDLRPSSARRSIRTYLADLSEWSPSSVRSVGAYGSWLPGSNLWASEFGLRRWLHPRITVYTLSLLRISFFTITARRRTLLTIHLGNVPAGDVVPCWLLSGKGHYVMDSSVGGCIQGHTVFCRAWHLRGARKHGGTGRCRPEKLATGRGL